MRHLQVLPDDAGEYVSPAEAARLTRLTTTRLRQIAAEVPTRLPTQRDDRGHRSYRRAEVLALARERRATAQAAGLPW